MPMSKHSFYRFDAADSLALDFIRLHMVGEYHLKVGLMTASSEWREIILAIQENKRNKRDLDALAYGFYDGIEFETNRNSVVACSAMIDNLPLPQMTVNKYVLSVERECKILAYHYLISDDIVFEIIDEVDGEIQDTNLAHSAFKDAYFSLSGDELPESNPIFKFFNFSRLFLRP